jgi:hypothetical protein
MTVLTEGKHRGEFIVSEANNTRSRKTGTVALGQNLVAGQLVALSGGSLIAMPGTLDTAGALTATCVGVLFDNYDATTDGDAGAAIAGAVYIDRDAEVLGAELTYPTETTDGDEAALCNVQLAALGIVVR